MATTDVSGVPASRVSLLLVDDQPANLLSLEAVLEDLGLNLVRAASGSEALRRILETEFAAILLDVNMPGMSGLEMVELMRKREKSRHTPVIFMTANSTDSTFAFEAYRLGAVDYLVKPFVPSILCAKVLVLVELFRLREQERLRSAAALRERDQLWRTTLTSIGDAVIATDTAGRITFLNAAAERLTGWSRAEAVGSDLEQVYAIVDEDSGAPVESPVRALFDRGAAPAGRTRLVARDGTRRPIDDSASAIRDEAGTLHGAVLVFRDITAQKQAEGERERLLRQVETERSRLADVFQRAPSFMAVLEGPEHVFERVNDRFHQFVGPRELVGRSLRAALPELEGQGLSEQLDEVYRTGDPFVGTDLRMTLQSDPERPPEIRFVDLVLQAVRGADGAVTGIIVQGVDLTARKLAEQDARAADRRVASILDSMTDAAFGVDRSYQYVYVNRQWEEAFGRTAAEVLGQGLWDLSPDLAGSAMEDVYRRAMDGETVTTELAVANGTGWLEVRAYPTPDGMGAYVRDISARKHAQDHLRQANDALEERVAARTAQLRREQTFLKAVLDNIADGVVACDADGVLTLFNRAMLDLDARPWPTLPGQWGAHHALFRPDGLTPIPPPEGPLARALAGETVHDAEMVLVPPGGSPKTVLASGQPILGVDGQKLGAVVSMHDVSERKQREAAQAEVAREQERSGALRRVASASRAMSSVLEVDSIRRILMSEARAIVGVQMAATSLVEVDDPLVWDHALVLSEEGDPGAPELRTHRTEGPHPLVRDTTEPIRLARDRLLLHPGYGPVEGWPLPVGWLSVPLVGYTDTILGYLQLSGKEARDGEFTEDDEAVLVQLAAVAAAGIENARLYERLKEQDRRKDEFLATLAHELRNPLAPVRVGLEILRRRHDPEAEADTVREMLERQIGQLVRLVDDLLDVSRVTSGKIALQQERIALGAVVEAALETSRPLLEASGHRLVVDLPTAPLHLRGDPSRLAQVLTNLVNNAAKYTPAGGVIEVRAEQGTGEAVLTVRDSGIGIPKEMLPRIFDMFTQVGASLDRSQGGLGIGLTLVRKLVEMHGGTVSAASAGAGAGSTFTVRLPLALAAAEAGPEGPPAVALPEPIPSGGRRVLIVDDNVDAAEILGQLLSFVGHTISLGHSGPAALEAVRSFRPDVLLLDIGLPGMNGYEVARHLRADPAAAGLVIVALTGWGTEDDRRRTREAGFDHHLTKPVEPEEIERLLADLPELPGTVIPFPARA